MAATFYRDYSYGVCPSSDINNHLAYLNAASRSRVHLDLVKLSQLFETINHRHRNFQTEMEKEICKTEILRPVRTIYLRENGLL